MARANFDTNFGRSQFFGKKYSMYFVELDRMLKEQLSKAEYSRTANEIVYNQLGEFATQVAKPIFRAYAPVRDWGGNLSAPRQTLLRDTILAVRSGRGTSEPSVRISMGAWGEYSIQGRGALSTSKGALKIILPGGTVIFRKRVGPATTRAFSQAAGSYDAKGDYVRDGTYPPPYDPEAGRKRMQWAEFAWDDIRKSGVLEQMAENIVREMLANSFLKDLVVVPGANTHTELQEYMRLLGQSAQKFQSSGGEVPGTSRKLSRSMVKRSKRRLRAKLMNNPTHGEVVAGLNKRDKQSGSMKKHTLFGISKRQRNYPGSLERHSGLEFRSGLPKEHVPRPARVRAARTPRAMTNASRNSIDKRYQTQKLHQGLLHNIEVLKAHRITQRYRTSSLSSQNEVDRQIRDRQRTLRRLEGLMKSEGNNS